MSKDPNCLILAELASKAVDFAKSGTPVSRADIPKLRYPPHLRPDWSVGESGAHAKQNRNSYPSQRAIGHLYRRIDLSDTERVAAREAKRQNRGMRDETEEDDTLLRAMEQLNVQGPTRRGLSHPISRALRPLLSRHIDVGSSVPAERTSEAQELFEAYAAELRHICVYNSLNTKPLTEEEVLIGTIASKTTQPRKRKSLMTQLRQQTDEIVKRIRIELSGKSPSSERTELEETLLRAWAAWQVSLTIGDAFGGKSFGIIALGAIFEVLRDLEDRDSARGSLFGDF